MKRLLNNINLPAKFLLLALFALTLFAVPSWLFIHEGNQQINVKELELQGIPVEKEMLSLLNLMQRHRAEAAIAIATNDPATPNRLALKARIDQLNAALLTTLSATSHNDALLQRFNALTAEWEQLQRDIDSRNLTLATSLNRHAEVIRSALDLNVDVLDFYSLSLDADLNTYQFIISSFSRLPDLTETLGQIRARGTSLLAKKDGIEDSDYARMEFQIRNGRNALRLYNANLMKSLETDEEVRAKFGGKGEAALKQASEALKIAEDVFVNRTKTDLKPAEFVALFTQAINQYNTFGLEASDEISRMLSEQIRTHRLAQVELLGVLAVLALFVVILGVYIIRSITGPVSDAAKVARDV
ncbi:MAG TPA: methyl-accepting chemotaxis protein, partial [Erwinia persicina]|nr:methyl-accepting chemotaxis protein [Erwinia persicina]